MARSRNLSPLDESIQTDGRGWSEVPFPQALSRDGFTVGKVQLTEYRQVGRFPIIDQGQQQVAGYWDNEGDVYQGPLPVVIFGDHTRAVKFVREPFVCGADGTKVLVPDRELFDPEFFFYALMNVDLPSRGYNRHFALLRGVTLPCPPLQEQRAIASVLRAVQQASDTAERVIASTRKLKRSLMRHLLSRGPVRDGDVRVRRSVPTEAALPEHWQTTSLGAIATIVMGQSPPGDAYNVKEVGVPLVTGPEDYGPISPHPNKWTSTVTRTCEGGDILFCVRGNTLGKLNLADRTYCIGRGVAAIRARAGTSDSSYLYFWLQAEAERFLEMSRGGGSTFPNINKRELEEWNVVLPPLDEQRTSALILQALERKLVAERDRATALARVFDGFLTELTTGKRRVAQTAGGS